MMGWLEQYKYTSTSLHSCIRTCRAATTRMLFRTLVTCAGPDTLPATTRQLSMSRKARFAKGVCPAPSREPPPGLLVARDMSTTELRISVRRPEEVACEAVGGKMMCRPAWPEMAISRAAEKLGLRMRVSLGWAISSL